MEILLTIIERNIIFVQMDMWNLSGGDCLFSLAAHDSFISSILIRPNVHQALTVSRDNTLKLWDLNSGQCLRTFEGHRDWVVSTVIHPNGHQALSASWDNTLKLWDLESGECLHTFSGHAFTCVTVKVFVTFTIKCSMDKL